MGKTKKRKVKKSKILLLILIILFIIGVYIFIFKGNKKQTATEIEVVDTIDDFGYELNDNETEYYNELFNSLKDLLKNEGYDEKEYASLIGKLFLADFYDLNSKIMKSDVGGTQFVYESYRNDFESGAIDGVYKSIESNVYGDRKQDLPIISKVDVSNITTNVFKYNSTSDINAYYIDFDITYKKNMGYPTQVSLVLIHNNNKLEVASMETK